MLCEQGNSHVQNGEYQCPVKECTNVFTMVAPMVVLTLGNDARPYFRERAIVENHS